MKYKPTVYELALIAATLSGDMRVPTPKAAVTEALDLLNEAEEALNGLGPDKPATPRT